MNGYDMMCNLADCLGEWCVLDGLLRYPPNDVAVAVMNYIAKIYNYSFSSEDDKL